ncbi:uncharacterized protein LOC135822218 [Sycon ciliatum]|uniref:uncharacterized protein LOC135822218 n=1 Tax=Sycon ciliatum TaxID=27933 RepID=UPI0031F6ECFF
MSVEQDICPSGCPFRVASSWKSKFGGGLQASDVFTSHPSPPNEWVEHAVVAPAAEHCLVERSEENDCPCEITIFPERGHRLSGFLAVCDARRVEVYADGEYCGTAKGQLEALQDTVEVASVSSTTTSPYVLGKVSVFLVTLPEENSTCRACRVRFVSLTRSDSLVLFSVRVSIAPVACTNGIQPSINMASVERWIDQVGAPRDKRAEALLDSVRRYQENRSSVAGELQQMVSQSAAAAGRDGQGNHSGGGVAGLAGMAQLLSGMNLASLAQSGGASSSAASGDALSSAIGMMLPHLKPVLDSMAPAKQHQPPAAEHTAAHQDAEADKSADTLTAADARHPNGCDAVRSPEQYVAASELVEMEKRLKNHIDERFDAMQQLFERQFSALQQLITSANSNSSSTALADASIRSSAALPHAASVSAVAQSNGTSVLPATGCSSTSEKNTAATKVSGAAVADSISGQQHGGGGGSSAGKTAGGSANSNEAMLQSLMGMFKTMRPAPPAATATTHPTTNTAAIDQTAPSLPATSSACTGISEKNHEDPD